MRKGLYVAILLVAGCAARGDAYWYRAASSPEQARLDLAGCRFEAEKAVASYGPGPRTYRLGDAIGQGIAQGLDIAQRKDRVGSLCMEAKGYALRHRGVEDDALDRTIRPTPAAATPQATPVAMQQPLGHEQPLIQKSEGPVVSAIGQWSFGAERTAKNSSCSQDPLARLTGKGPGVETFAITCSNGDVLTIRCEYGQCRALR